MEERKILTPNEVRNKHTAYLSKNPDLKEYIEKLEHQNITDPLTGLYNRRGFDEFFKHQCEMTQRYGQPFAISMGDIDDFKSYNDEFGHDEGDRALVEISRCMQYNIRDTDRLCRYGGEEFTIIMPETKGDSAELVIERVRKNIEELELDCKVTMSFGLFCFPDDVFYVSDLMTDAIPLTDRALYYAKKTGKNRVCTVRFTAENNAL